VLPVPEGDKEWYLYAARAGLPFGVATHRRFVSACTIARREAPTNRLAPPAFSFIMVRRRRWLAAMKIAWQVPGVMRASHGAKTGHHHFHP
jgi:hypothetical protein